MWTPLKITHPSQIIRAEYEDFALMEVEKITAKNTSIVHYMININIYDITEQSIDLYKMDEVEKAMKKIRKAIEELYEEIPLFSEDDVDSWIDSFCDMLSELQ